MKEKIRKVIIPAGVWLAVWTLAAAAVGRELILPSPAAVVRALCTLMGTEAFWRGVGMSLVRVGLGALLGAGAGTALGAACYASGTADALLSPVLRGIRTVPVVSFILLLYFWFPTGWVPTAVSALMALPVVWRAARQGWEAAQPQLLELADHYGLGFRRSLVLVRLPAALPALSAGWETALGLAWKAGVAAEVLCQPRWAAGSGLQGAKAALDSPALFAWTGAIVAASLLTEGLLKKGLSRWKGGGAA